MYSKSILSRLTSTRNFHREVVYKKVRERTQHNLKTRNLTPKSNDFNEIISGELIRSDIDWQCVRKKLLGIGGRVNQQNVDAATLQYLVHQKNFAAGKSFMQFLNGGANLATVGKYFKLFYVANEAKRVDSCDESTILELYEDVKRKYAVLDAVSSENILLALSLTKEWRECLKLLQDVKLTSNVTNLAYSAAVAACFRNAELDLGWKLFNEMLDEGYAPTSAVYSAFAQCNDCLRDVGKLFSTLETNYLHLTEDAAEVFKSTLTSAKAASITDRGTCKNCGSKLDLLKVSADEFEALKAEFFKNVIIGRNVFNKTTPSEVLRFKEFVQNMGEFDVIVDGLNAAYSLGTKQTPLIGSRIIASVVQYFRKQNKNVLVIGRKHMQNWPKSNMQHISRNASVFLTENMSQDDPYLLYCALASGLNTTVVTRDLMRSHLFLLKSQRSKMLFKKWFEQNQYYLQYVRDDGVPVFKVPPPYTRIAQKNGGYWHVPVEGEVDSNLWICVRV